MGRFTSYIKGESQLNLGPVFQRVWEEFIDDCSKENDGHGYVGIKFELIKGNRSNVFYICCRPELDASATTTLAIIENIDETKLLFRTVAADEWTTVDNESLFVKCLGSLVASGSSNSRLIQLMQALNSRPMYEGILVTGEPYEIASDSIRVLVPNQECRQILDQANLGVENYECDVNNATINASVAYPPTMRVVNPAYSYRFFTFQGFLFEVLQQPHVVQQSNTISFRVRLKYNMRM